MYKFANKLFDTLIRRLNPNWGGKIAFLLVSFGISIGSQALKPWFELLLKATVATGIVTEEQSIVEKILFIGVGLFFIVGGVLMFIAISKAKKPALDIIHQSIEKSLTKETRKHNWLHYSMEEINQVTAMDTNSVEKRNLETALEELKEGKISIERFVNNNNVQTITYYPLAHIPFIFLLGYQLSHKLAQVHFKEWSNDHWEEIVNYKFLFPQLHLLPISSEPDATFDGDIAIKLSVTTEVLDAHLSRIPLHSPLIYHLKLDEPQRLVIKSKTQIDDYTKVFVKLLDDIRTKYPNRKGVHIFCSAQPSLCFNLGANISSRMNSNVWVYNYVDSSPLKYPWALKMFKQSSDTNDSIRILA